EPEKGEEELEAKFELTIVEVVKGMDVSKETYVGDGKIVNSQFLNGLTTDEAIIKMIDWLESENKGKRQITYRLRDWLFSRQRYWGEAIPIIHWEDGTMTTVPEDDLPLELPEMV